MDARFYFYFRDKAAARAATPQLEQEGLAVEVRLGADEQSWLALGRTKVDSDDDLDHFEERFEALAEQLGADYDGYDRD